jgi:hypothetical protein
LSDCEELVVVTYRRRKIESRRMSRCFSTVLLH